MPRNYDFSVRSVDWSEYKKDFLLRTDAVWERSKLLDIFYTHYKVSFDPRFGNMVADLIRVR